MTRDDLDRAVDLANATRNMTERWYEILCNRGISHRLADLMIAMVRVQDAQAHAICDLVGMLGEGTDDTQGDRDA